MNHQEEAAQSALDYYRAGLIPIKVPLGKKGPTTKGWQAPGYLDSLDVVKAFSQDSNVGLLLGEQPNGTWLTDLDLDSDEAISIAHDHFNKNTCAHARDGKIRHYWFKTGEEIHTKKYIDTDGSMICELRGSGLQTIVPPSIHPSGEQLVWAGGGWSVENLPISYVEYPKRITSLVASGALLARHWPEKGSRQYLVLALTGMLLNQGWSEDGVQRYVMSVLKAAKDHSKERRSAITSTIDQFGKDGKVTGGPTVANIIGDNVYAKLLDFLDLPEPPQINLVEEDDEEPIPGRLVSVGELRKQKLTTNDEVVEGLLWAGKTHWLYADPNVGKTMLALAIAQHVAAGKDFAGRMVSQGPVVIIEEDSSLAVIFDYLDNFDDIYDLDSDSLPIHINPTQGIRILNARGKDRILDLVASVPVRPALVVLDSCERILPSASFNSREVDPLDQLLKTLANQGIANLVLDHTTKSLLDHPNDMDVLYGSRAKSAIADVMIQLGGSIKKGVMTASFTKFRGDTPPDIDMFYHSDTGFKLVDRPGHTVSEYEQNLYGWFISQPRKWTTMTSIVDGYLDDKVPTEKETKRLLRSLNAMSLRRLLRRKKVGDGYDYRLNNQR